MTLNEEMKKATKERYADLKRNNEKEVKICESVGLSMGCTADLLFILGSADESNYPEFAEILKEYGYNQNKSRYFLEHNELTEALAQRFKKEFYSDESEIDAYDWDFAKTAHFIYS